MRRSEHNKREKYGARAKALLEAFYWQPDEKALLEIMADEFFTMPDARELRWNAVREGVDCIILKEREIAFSPEIFSLFVRGLREGLDFNGESIEAPEEKLFSHETGKNILKQLDSYKVG
ncbi:MAG: hypothetical protein PQJ60_10060 [Spirochaetales bacterium]|nr:hypothetical protein [Spirochaetales bacterium]